MTDLEKLRQWLLTYPAWGTGRLHTDYRDAVPENFGLYPRGQEELGRQADILGNVTVRYRCRYVLSWVTACQEDKTPAAAQLMDFQQWVQAQSIRGLAPTFGHVPHGERLRAEKGRLKEASSPGTAVYEVTLTAEFTIIYGEND